MPCWTQRPAHITARATTSKRFCAACLIDSKPVACWWVTRFFATFFLLAELQQRGVDGVFEQYGARRRSTDFRRGHRLGERDHLIDLEKPKVRPSWMTEMQFAQAPDRLTVRELHVGGKTLVTTLLCAKRIPKGELKSLYRQRWHVELDFRHLKTTMGMEMLASKSPAMAIKEIWIHLLAYNLIRRMMLQAASVEGVSPRQLSFKHALQLCMASRHYFAHLEGAAWDLLRLIAKQRVGQRPGRIEPRVVKRRPKPFPLLTEHRELAREKTAASWASIVLKSVPFVSGTFIVYLKCLKCLCRLFLERHLFLV